MILKFPKITLFFSLAFLLFLTNCTSDSNELDTNPNENGENNNEQIIVNEKPDITEEMTIMPDDEETTPVVIVDNEETTPVVIVDNEETTPVVTEDNENTTEDPQTNEETNDVPETTENNEPRVLTQSEIAQLNFAITSIFDKTSSSPNRNAKKWNMAVNLLLSGAFGNEEVNFINDFANELAEISPNIDLNIVSESNQANVEVYFATREQYINERPNFINNYTPRGSAVGRANTTFRIPSYLINGRKIWIDPSSRNFYTVIKHEILHILGFDHTDSNDSVLFPTPSNDPTLSKDDIFTIGALYNNLINASSVESEIKSTVENNIEEFFE